MDLQKRLAEYQAKAKAAEEHAAKTRDPVTRRAWESIAESYRDLARRQEYPN